MNNTLDILTDYLQPQNEVSFTEFVCSDEFCNSSDMFKYWTDWGMSLKETTSELLIGGSIGGGKSFFANYYLAYRIYKLFSKGSPQKQLDLAADSEIFSFYFTVSMEMAKQSGFSHLYTIFENCKWFQQNAPINKNLTSVIEFKKYKFHIKAGSDFGHQIGLNVWAFILDEANFRSGVGTGMAAEYEEVTMLYQQLIDRQYSRTSNADGTINALAILISSASYQTSFLEKRKNIIKGDPNATSITAVAYEIRPEKYSKEKFEVFIGAGTVEPAIVEDEDHKKKLLRAANLEGTGNEDSFFRMVPVSLIKQFKTNLPLALQNHCGVATNLQGSFMVNQKFLYASYDETLPICFQSEELEASTEDDTQLIEYFIPENIVYAENPHSLFLDLSVQGDMGALVCFRYDGVIDGVERHTKVFELKIKPPRFPAATKIGKVQQLIIDLSLYINIAAFASDQYQSTSLRQNIQEELGLDDIRVSIDSSDIPHLLWTRMLVEGKIRQRKSEVLEKEVEEAVHDYKKHRVLKAKGSTDDVLQGNVGACFLSETFAKNYGSLEGLYNGKANLIGGKSMRQVLNLCGYKN